MGELRFSLGELLVTCANILVGVLIEHVFVVGIIQVGLCPPTVWEGRFLVKPSHRTCVI